MAAKDNTTTTGVSRPIGSSLCFHAPKRSLGDQQPCTKPPLATLLGLELVVSDTEWLYTI